ncbi:MAG TPA: conjugal transfer protein TraX [Clostridiaceae bacterium]|nr:conjugal transfer protein TraX [Clostridiaceae bacterium]
MNKITLNANQLKLIAIIAMTIDHIADLFYPGFPAQPLPIALHLIGRLTAPIMWFFVCEGFHYTRNAKKYMLRMFIFAVISHFAYCFAFGINPIPFSTGIFNQTSVMYPLFISVVILWLQYEEKSMNKYLKFAIVFVLIWSAFPADWSCIAVLAIQHMYRKRGDVKGQMIAIVFWVFFYGVISFFFVSKVYALVLVGVLMVYPLLKMYNGEKGKTDWMKMFFYIYYPLHLIIIGILRILMYGNMPLLS